MDPKEERYSEHLHFYVSPSLLDYCNRLMDKLSFTSISEVFRYLIRFYMEKELEHELSAEQVYEMIETVMKNHEEANH